MKRVLVTGASGFIGRHALTHLKDAGFEVHAVSHSGFGVDGPQWHQADLLHSQSRRALLHSIQPEFLLHFAWYVPPGKYWTSPENIRWLTASLELVQEFAEAGGQRFVGAGTCAEYSWDPGGICVEGETPLAPASLYGASKNALASLLPHICSTLGLSYAWGRIFFPFGPGEPSGRLVPSIIASIRNGEPARCSLGTQIRDFIYVDDVARAFTHVLSSNFQGAVNIGTGREVSIALVAQSVAALLGRPDLLRLGALPARSGEPDRLIASTNVLEQLGFVPTWTLEQAVQRTVEL